MERYTPVTLYNRSIVQERALRGGGAGDAQASKGGGTSAPMHDAGTSSFEAGTSASASCVQSVPNLRVANLGTLRLSRSSSIAYVILSHPPTSPESYKDAIEVLTS